uniref:Si:ch211-81n22.1 n=1 Tax=Gouania willdenowi TaxID=441366 RepID=A0A8C5GPB5_GOUWI
MQLVIRRYRPSDRDAVVTLFRVGIKEHIQPCFYNAIGSFLHLSVTLSLCVCGYVLSSLWAALLLPTAWMAMVYYCCYKVYDGYVRLRLQTDMQDVVGSFLSRPDDCFWVAEAEVDKRTQVVGMVAVVAKDDGRQKCGELFRMIISPQCRRMGLGSKLAQTVFDFGKKQGFSKIILETSSTQKAGIALYRKLANCHSVAADVVYLHSRHYNEHKVGMH